MVDNALIINLSENEIQVVPLISDACINCEKSGCAKQGKPFSVANPKKIEIKKGEILGIGGLAGQGKIGIANGIMGLYPATGAVTV